MASDTVFITFGIEGGLNPKLHAVCDEKGWRLVVMLLEGQMSDRKGARLMLDLLPAAKALLADRGRAPNKFRAAPCDKEIKPCLPSSRSRKVPVPHDRTLHRQRHRIGTMFGWLKDRRRAATRHNRCAHTFSATCIAATATFRLRSSNEP